MKERWYSDFHPCRTGTVANAISTRMSQYGRWQLVDGWTLVFRKPSERLIISVSNTGSSESPITSVLEQAIRNVRNEGSKTFSVCTPSVSHSPMWATLALV